MPTRQFTLIFRHSRKWTIGARTNWSIYPAGYVGYQGLLTAAFNQYVRPSIAFGIDPLLFGSRAVVTGTASGTSATNARGEVFYITYIDALPVYEGVLNSLHQWHQRVEITSPEWYQGAVVCPSNTSSEINFRYPGHLFDVRVFYSINQYIDEGDIIRFELTGDAAMTGGTSLYPAVVSPPVPDQTLTPESDGVTMEYLAGTSPNGHIALYGWHIRNSTFQIMPGAATTASLVSPYTTQGNPASSELLEATYSARLVVIDEHGYAGVHQWTTGCNPTGWESFTVEGAMIGTAIDRFGQVFSAVNESTGVRVGKFPRGSSTRESRAFIADAKNPSLALDENAVLTLGYTQRSTGNYKTKISTDAGRTFN